MSNNMKIGLAALLLLGLVVVCAFMLLHDPGYSTSSTEEDGGVLSEDNASTEDGRTGAGRTAPGADLSQRSGEPAKADVTLAGSSSARAQGRVVDREGNPIEGVCIEETVTDEIKIRFYGFYGKAQWTDTGCRTGADGSFSAAVPAHRLARTILRFHHPEYDEYTAPLFTTIPCLDHIYLLDDVFMEPVDFIRGRVVDEMGKAVAGCQVASRSIRWTEEVGSSTRDCLVTDDKGAFLLKVNSKREIHVSAYHRDLGFGWSRKVLPGRGKAIPEVKIILNKVLPLAGRLMNGDGTPAPGIDLTVSCEIDDFQITQQITTLEEGAFTCAPLPEGSYTIKGGLRRKKKSEDRYGILAEGVNPGTDNLLLYLPPCCRLVLRITDEGGSPILAEPDVDFMSVVKSGYSRSSGSALWSGIVENPEPGTYVYGNVWEGLYDLRVSAEGHASSTIEDIEIPPPPEEVPVHATLKKMGMIRGKVLHQDGRPVANVILLKEGEDLPEPEEGDPESPDREKTMRDGNAKEVQDWRYRSFSAEGIRRRYLPGDFKEKSTITDEEGRFVFEGVEKGIHHLFFKVQGREVYRHPPVPVTEENLEVEIEIHLPALGGAIEGGVHDGTGNPLKGACVVAWDGDEMFNVTRSDEQGRYGFLNLADGRYVVDARMISNAGGGKSRGYRAELVTGSEPSLDELHAYNATITGGGTCRLDLTITDPWNSVVNCRLYTTSTRPLPEHLRVSLRELDEKGEKSKGDEKIRSDLFEYNTDKQNQNWREGQFRFMDLRAGYYRLAVTWHNARNEERHGDTGHSRIFGNWEHVEDFTLAPSTTINLDVHLLLATIDGTVVDSATNEALSSARMVLFPESDDEDDDSMRVKVDDEGYFIEENIPAGHYTLAVFHDRYRPFLDKGFQLHDNGDQRDLCIRMEAGACTVEGGLKITNPAKRPEETWWMGPEWRVAVQVPDLGSFDIRDCKVGEDGKFLLKGLPPGPATLVVYCYASKNTELALELPLSVEEPLEIEVSYPESD